MKNRSKTILLSAIILLLTLNLVITIVYGPQLAKAESKAQYKVVFCDKRQLESTLNEMTANGWEYVHSEMAMDVVIFKK